MRQGNNLFHYFDRVTGCYRTYSYEEENKQ